MAFKDDPAQSPTLCAVSFCHSSLQQQAGNGLVRTDGKYSAMLKICVPKLHTMFAELITELFILAAVSPRNDILPQNTSLLFKPTRDLPCINSKLVPILMRSERSFNVCYYISNIGNSLW